MDGSQSKKVKLVRLPPGLEDILKGRLQVRRIGCWKKVNKRLQE